jgi:hypothetical protein
MTMHSGPSPDPLASGEWTNPRTVVTWSLVLSVLGLLLLALGLVVDPSRAWFSYLAMWTFGTTVCFGALVLLMTGHAAKAGWMVVTRRITEAIVTALPLYLVLFVPILFGLGRLYAWAGPREGLDADVLRAIDHKRLYFNPAFFVARTLLYFAVSIAIGALLRAWSTANDRAPRLARIRRMRALSGGGLPVVALTLTWASFDWTMSLEPSWYSTIFGLYYFAGAFVGAIGLVCVMLHLSRLRPSMNPRVTPDHAQALGRVLFAMTCFWAYQAFSQLLIYWIGDVPEEISYYKVRTTNTWWLVTYLLVFGNFVLPFFVLIRREYKRHTRFLAWAGAWMLLMHFVDVYWLIMPVHDPSGLRPHWLDLAAILFIGGLSSAYVVTRYFQAAPLPAHDPELVAGLGYEASI